MTRLPSEPLFGGHFDVGVPTQIADSNWGKCYTPPDPRDDPRLERDMTRGAQQVDTSRPNSWAAQSKKRRRTKI